MFTIYDMTPYSCFNAEMYIDEVNKKKKITLTDKKLVKPNATWM